jgi:hypothetical protein
MTELERKLLSQALVALFLERSKERQRTAQQPTQTQPISRNNRHTPTSGGNDNGKLS